MVTRLSSLRKVGFIVPLAVAALFAAAPSLGLIGFLRTRELLLASIYALVVAGFNLSFGYGGQLALGQVAVFAGGAYSAAILFDHGNHEISLALLLSIGVAAIMGVLTGLPGLRFGHWTLALMAFFLVLMIPDVTAVFRKQTHGLDGIAGVLGPKLFGHTLTPNQFYAAGVVTMALGLLLLRNLVLSRYGHSMLILKQGTTLARAVGLSPFKLRLSAYVIGSLPAGAAGVFYAYYSAFVQPDIFNFDLVTLVLAASIVGGTTSIWGAPIAAAILVIGPDQATSFKKYSIVAYGVFLMLAGIGFSGGIAGLATAIGRRLSGWLPAAAVVPAEPDHVVTAGALSLAGQSLATTGVSKRFGGVQAMRDVDFTAGPGAITAIIGANGAGKTTLLNAISGHVPGDTGEIRLGDRIISKLGPEKIARAGASRTFQTPQIPETLTVLEVAASARIGPAWINALSIALRSPGYRRRKHDDLARGRAALAFVGLSAVENAAAAELPLGQRRILEVARCIAADPAVVLLDEPAAGLDPAGIEHLREVLIRLRDAGATVVLIEHNVTFVMDVADRVFVMDLGLMIAEGTPDEVRNDEQVIASYLGRRHSTHHTLDDQEPVTVGAGPQLQVVEAVEQAVAVATGEVVLAAANARFAYGDLVAVWDVSLQARAGEAVAVVGRNGAGKTTLMFGLAGSLPAASGSITLLGQDVTGDRAEERARAGLCLVPEGKRIFRELTVEENIAVGLPRAMRAKDRRARVAEMLERFPILYEKRADRAGALSGGQQQLLAIASAVTMQPRVLLVDEPSSGLSPIAVEQVMTTLEELKREGLAIVLVEQLVEDVVTGIADHVIVIEEGHVVLEDIPENISLADLERRLYVA